MILYSGSSLAGRRGQRQPQLRDPARHRAGHHAPGRSRRQGLRRQGQPRGGAATRHLSRHPDRENTKHKPAFFPKILYKGRARIEQGNGKLKRFKRIALRCEKTAQNFAAFIALACTFILVKSVHTA
jgi:transposase